MHSQETELTTWLLNISSKLSRNFLEDMIEVLFSCSCRRS